MLHRGPVRGAPPALSGPQARLGDAATRHRRPPLDLPARPARSSCRIRQGDLTNPYEHRPSTRTPWHEEPFSLDALAEALCSRGVDVQIVPALADLPAVVRDETQPGDVVLLSLREQFADLAAAIEDALASRVTT